MNTDYMVCFGHERSVIFIKEKEDNSQLLSQLLSHLLAK